MTKPDHIKGLNGREPIGAALTLGVKHASRGFPVEKDRFHIVLPYEADGRREHHPAYAFFNNAPVERRKVIRGVLIHSNREECFEYHLKAQVLGRSAAHPDKRPACVGDGDKAIRWTGPGPDDFMDIKCPNEKCEYRLTSPPSCKPWARMLFQLAWTDERHPSTIVKYTTGSWYTISNLLGFFEHIEDMAHKCGLADYSLAGIPFSLTLVERTKASAKTRFPTVSISLETNIVEFFQAQRAGLRTLAQPVPEALPDLSQQDPSVVYEDLQTITVPASKK